ncbi:NAD(P)/FAD-dependent oxidoreductase [Candidatus Neptunochlamydia vexilliferae]|nr:NAD(P)/FAD-dependent oxidoreductase [Candidatus Neptunochlamydia vexilliferae]
MIYTRVVIVGGGFGGLNCAKTLKKANLDVLLIDKKNHHLFQPLLYQVASAALSPADIATPLREIFADQKNTTVIMGTVDQVDKKNRKLLLQNGDEVPYDYLVIGTGARHSYFGNDQWEPLAPGLKTVVDALKIRERILISFEKAERTDSIQEAERHLNFVIIGGGPTGVEMAGAIAEIAHKTLFKNFRRINPEKSKIYLVEGAPRVLPPFPEKLSERARKDLEKMGVRVITNELVTNITEEGVQVGDDFIEAGNVIWAAGNIASPLLKTLDIPLDRQGRAMVEPDLSIPDHPEIFVIGDAACSIGKDGKPLPAVAPTAIQQGRYIGKLIRRQIPKKKRRPFKYFDKGGIATIGKNKAVGFFKAIHFKGIFAWLIWGFIHIFYLVNYRSQFGVMLDWTFHYLTGLRGARLIHKSIKERPDKK